MPALRFARVAHHRRPRLDEEPVAGGCAVDAVSCVLGEREGQAVDDVTEPVDIVEDLVEVVVADLVEVYVIDSVRGVAGSLAEIFSAGDLGLGEAACSGWEGLLQLGGERHRCELLVARRLTDCVDQRLHLLDGQRVELVEYAAVCGVVDVVVVVHPLGYGTTGEQLRADAPSLRCGLSSGGLRGVLGGDEVELRPPAGPNRRDRSGQRPAAQEAITDGRGDALTMRNVRAADR